MFLIFSLLLSPFFLASCKEADDTEVEEFPDWQAQNEAYFETQYQEHVNASSADVFVLKSLSLPDSNDEVAHTGYILVDVLEHGATGSTESPLFTGTAELHYRGWLIPSVSYPEGYQFDTSYQGTFDEQVSVPTSFAVSAVVDGFATALQYMHRGDHWRVTIPYQLGYGTSDYSGIPGYSTLIFEIRLVDF